MVKQEEETPQVESKVKIIKSDKNKVSAEIQEDESIL